MRTSFLVGAGLVVLALSLCVTYDMKSGKGPVSTAVDAAGQYMAYCDAVEVLKDPSGKVDVGIEPLSDEEAHRRALESLSEK